MSESDIVQDFLVESYENLDRLDRELVGLEKNPQDRDALAGVFRTIHTIKGTCGFLGFSKLEKVAHVGESLLSRLRDGQLGLTPEITTALLSMVDAVRQMLKAIESSGQDGQEDYPELREKLTQLQGGEQSAKPVIALPLEKAEVANPLATIRIAEAVMSEVEVEKASAPQATGGSVKEDAAAGAPAGEGRGRDASAESIRVGVTLLDKLMNLVGELVLARNQLLQLSNTMENTGFQAVSQRMNLIATELQEEVMKTRMQPIGNVWGQFPRTVRDVALGCGKQVNIEMEGKETELDKTIIEAVKDPLTHLMRNAVDHGIESPEIRRKAGKNPAGRLLLRAYHEGGQVNIEISDDGAGLDEERIRKKAVARGIISAAQAEQMSERDIFNLIFLPGFSTADKVTNVSGRGVGMDVVKTNVEKIGGAVDIQSTRGKGTTIRVKIPLTLAIIPALIVTCRGDRYAIPQLNLLELVRLEPDQVVKGIERVHGAPVHRLRGRLLPLVYLRRELEEQSGGAADSIEAQGDALPDFMKAREAHAAWIPRLQRVLEGSETLTTEQAGSSSTCALGKWLYSSGLLEYGDIPEMRLLEEKHKRFHELVRELIASRSQEEKVQAEFDFGPITALSQEVIGLLTTTEKKVGEARNVNIVVLQADERQFGLVVDDINDTEEIVVKPLRKQLNAVKTFAGSSIMGDGKVALILDVLGLARRASVVSEDHEAAAEQQAGVEAGSGSEKQTFLLFTGPDDSRMAIPISTLARLEEFPIAQVETTGSQWVTQYRGKILPLIQLNRVLEERRHKTRGAAPAADGRPLQVLVLQHEGRSFGLVVERILDIIEDAAQVKSAATRPAVLYSVVIGERVTELLDIPAIVRTAEADVTRTLAAKAAGGAN
jgi:chemotaxis protein histidine kinase CheA